MSQLKNIALFIVKAVSFTIIFWGLWLYVLKPITSPSQSASDSSQDAQTKALDKYNEQAKRAAEQLDRNDAEQKRMHQLITTQEEQARRYNLILDKWEKQAGIKK